MKTTPKQIIDIIIDIKLKRATISDREILLDWLRESKENTLLYRKIIRGESIKERYLAEEGIKNTLDCNAVEKQILEVIRKINRRRVLKKIVASTAAASILIGVFIVINHHNTPQQAQITKSAVNIVKTEKISNSAIKLTIGSGEEIDLSKDKELMLASAKVEDSKISYDELYSKTEEIETHKIEIGRGNCYQLILSDGSKVWLNSDTELEYPTKFVDSNRVVKLIGEAYFEVIHDKSKPFIVECNGQKVKVLGTTFNINAYQNDSIVRTTLVTGAVEVKNEKTGRDVILKSGMQTQLNINSGNISVKQNVNCNNIISWTNGTYTFVNEDLSTIVQTISRWFAVDFIVESDITNHTFNGSISRNDDLRNILNTFTVVGGPQFRIIGDKIYIK